MGPSSLRSVADLPRRLYRRSQARRSAREESRFSTRLQVDPLGAELLLSPHWDDAVLDCFGVLSGEREVQVINVFAAIPAPGRLTVWDATTGAQDSAQRARERLAEDARALARARRQPINLELLDSQYRPGLPEPTLAELDAAVCAQVAAAARVYAPAGIGGHVDHLLARRYARMLLARGMPVTLYAELPYCILHGWPPWVDGRAPEPNRNVDAFWSSFLRGVAEMPPVRSAEVVHLQGERAHAKLEAMRCYETQFPCLNYGARDLLEQPAIYAFEVRWELEAQGATG